MGRPSAAEGVDVAFAGAGERRLLLTHLHADHSGGLTVDGHAAAERLSRSGVIQPSPPIWQTIRHSAFETGWTDRRGSLTSAIPVRRWSALIRSRLTGVGSFCTAAQDPRHSPTWGFMSLVLPHDARRHAAEERAPAMIANPVP